MVLPWVLPSDCIWRIFSSPSLLFAFQHSLTLQFLYWFSSSDTLDVCLYHFFLLSDGLVFQGFVLMVFLMHTFILVSYFYLDALSCFLSVLFYIGIFSCSHVWFCNFLCFSRNRTIYRFWRTLRPLNVKPVSLSFSFSFRERGEEIFLILIEGLW